ncbi:MAG: glycosyltransferase family A protein [Alphaproteobacteria bacterium]|nr:glycosyltransferase family A protein [Alphaproteobacteria bacterium]
MSDSQGLDGISVVIPLYNKRDHIGPCLESVLAQTWQKFEIIVVNDASTDGSLEAIAGIEDPRITVFHRDRAGPGAGPARNLGVSKAKFSWCAFLDADDRWHPEYLETMNRAVSALNDGVGLAFAGFEIIGSDGSLRPDKFAAQIAQAYPRILDFRQFVSAWLANHNSPNRTSATMIRKAVLCAAGGFPEEERSRRGEDKDTWLRVMTKTRAVYVPVIGMSYRSGGTNPEWFAEPPCICRTIRKLLSGQDLKDHKRLLRRLHNDEILNYVKERSRSAPVPKRLFSDFYVLSSPLAFGKIIGIWLLPTSANRLLRSVRKRLSTAT